VPKFQVGDPTWTPRQADIAIGQGQADAQVWSRFAVGARRRVRGRSRNTRVGEQALDEEVRLGSVKASQAADPLAIPALVIVAVEGVAIAKGAHGIAHGIIAAFETRQRVIILLVMAHVNRAEGMQVVMDKTQDLVKVFTRIADDF